MLPPDATPSDEAAADLSVDTAVTRVPAVPGCYTASLTDRWSYAAPSGGVLMTMALRAMQEELADPDLRVVSATAIFCSRILEGPMHIQVNVLRHGGAAAQVRAALAQAATPGPGLEVIATFARHRDGPDMIDAVFPAVPSPKDAAPYLEDTLRALKMRLPFLQNFEGRLAKGYPSWEPGWPAGPAEFAQWFRYLKPQKLASGALDPLAIPPIADTMPGAIRMKLGPTYPPFIAPSLDLTVHFLDDTSSDWLLVSTRSRRASAGYATAEAEIWGADGKLAAIATQTMMLRKYPLST
jgi:acyl-CoA thioesterase